MGRFDNVLTDPEYSALDDNQKLQVWDGLFKKHVAADPEYAALNDEQKRNTYDQFVRKYYTPGQSKPVSKVNINSILPSLQESPLQKTKAPVKAVSPVDTNAPMNQEQAAQSYVSNKYNINAKGSRNDSTITFVPANTSNDKPEFIEYEPTSDVNPYSEAKQRKIEEQQINLTYTKRKIEQQQKELADLDAKPELTSYELDRQNFLRDRINFDTSLLPYYETGMTQVERNAYDASVEIMRKNPAMSYPFALTMGAMALGTGAYTMFTPDGKYTRKLSGFMAGMSSEGSLFGNIVRSTIYSAPMTAAIVINPALGTVLSQTMISSDKIKDYYQDGQLTQTEATSAAASSAIQTMIEVGTTQSQVKAIRDAWKLGGESAAKALLQKQFKELISPTTMQFGKTMLITGAEEGFEEVTQNISDKLVSNIINEDPLPDPKTWAKELALDFVGGAFGGVVMGGIGGGVNLMLNNQTRSQIDKWKEESPATAYLSDAIDELNSGDPEKARKSLAKAKWAATSIDFDKNGKRFETAGIDPVPSQNKAIMRGFALVTDALNLYDAKTVIEKESAKQQDVKPGPATDGSDVANNAITDVNTQAAPVVDETDASNVPGAGAVDQNADNNPLPSPVIDETKDIADQADQLHKAATESTPIFDNLINAISEVAPNTSSSFRVKEKHKIEEKVNRPDKQSKGYKVSDIGDSIAGRTTVNNVKEIEDIVPELLDYFEANGIKILNSDFERMMSDEPMFKAIYFDILLPNGVKAEYQIAPKQMIEASKTKGHKLYEWLRERTNPNDDSPASFEYVEKRTEMFALYSEAMRSFFQSSQASHPSEDIAPDFARSMTALSDLALSKWSHSQRGSANVAPSQSPNSDPLTQGSEGDLRSQSPNGSNATSRVVPGNVNTKQSSKNSGVTRDDKSAIDSTSIDNIVQNSDDASNSQDKNQRSATSAKVMQANTDRIVRSNKVQKNYLLDNKDLPELDISYEIAESDDMISSHDEEGSVNPLYPKELQPREERGSNVQREITNNRAIGLIPEVYGDAPTVQNGAPMIGSDNIVDAGNNRTMALKRMYKHFPKVAAKYKQWLIDNAQRLGLDAEAIAKMEKPILIKRRVSDITPAQREFLATGSNNSVTDKYTPVEQASLDAKKLSKVDIDLTYRDDGTVDWNSNPDFVRSFLRDVIPESEWVAMAPNYNPTNILINRIVNALVIKAYGDNAYSQYLVNTINDSSDAVAKNIINSLVLAAPMVSEVKQGIANGNYYDIDISENLVKAASRYVRSIIAKEPIDVLIDQAEVGVNDELDSLDKAILRRFMKFNRSSKQIVDEISDFYDMVKSFGDPSQQSLFGDAPITNTQDLLSIVSLSRDVEQLENDLIDIQKDEAKVLDKLDDIVLTQSERAKLNDRLSEMVSKRKAIEKTIKASLLELRNLRSKQSFVREGQILELANKQSSADVAKKMIAMLPKDAIKNIDQSPERIIVDFTDGRTVTINLLDDLIDVKWQGEDRKAAGQMIPGKNVQGKFTATLDIVRNYNRGNLTGYHEGFHLAYYMFLNDSQRSWLQGYYKEVMRKSGEYTDTQLNDPVQIEEFMADAFADVAHDIDINSDSLIVRIWKSLLDRIHGYLQAYGIISKDMTAKDLFKGIKSGKYDASNSITIVPGLRNKLIPEESHTSEMNIVNPVNSKASSQEKLNQLKALREASRPVFESLLERIKSEIGISANANDKKDTTALSKVDRPETKTEKPWISIEHIRDYYRGKAILTDPRQIIQIAGMLDDAGVGIVKFDYMKFFEPKIYGFRVMSFDLRMPNGLIVEFYTPLKEIEDVKDNNHKLYEKWRDKSAEYKMANKKDYEQDLHTSRDVYNKAFNAALSRLGISQSELRSSLMNSFLSLGLSQELNSDEILPSKQPISQLPSESRIKNVFKPTISALESSGSNETSKRSKVITTSIDNIMPNNQIANKSQGNSGIKNKLLETKEYDEVVSKYKDTDQWLKAPNGKRSNLNERQWVQVRTPQFINWFGDWLNDPKNASKVVDENGEPMVVYHGSRENFVEFNRPMNFFTNEPYIADSYSSGAGGHRRISEIIGITVEAETNYYRESEDVWVSPDGNTINTDMVEKLLSQDMAIAIKEGERVLPVFIASKNPLDLRNGSDGKEVLSTLLTMNNKYVELIISGVEKDSWGDRSFDWGTTKWEGHQKAWRDIIFPQLSNLGYDGLIFPDEFSHTTISPFSPTQIKSATANVGEFSSSNPDIRYKLQNVYHGSGAFFDRFDLQYIGSGEGVQAFGWGIYVTERKGVAKGYAAAVGKPRHAITVDGVTYNDKISLLDYFDSLMKGIPDPYNDVMHYSGTLLSEGADRTVELIKEEIQHRKDPLLGHDTVKNTQGMATLKALQKALNGATSDKLLNHNLYTLDVWANHTEDVLDWDNPITEEQRKKVIAQAKKEGVTLGNDFIIETPLTKTGESLYRDLRFFLPQIASSPQKTSEFLLRAGIDGIKYPVEAMSGGTGEKGYNYVVFDADQIDIKEHTRYKVIEEKNLVTIHNLSEDNLRKVIQNGGIPMPSLAITNIQNNHHNEFGSISLIAGKDIIDISAKSPVYAQDAWTPRYPTIYYIPKGKYSDYAPAVESIIKAMTDYAKMPSYHKFTEHDLLDRIKDNGVEKGIFWSLRNYLNPKTTIHKDDYDSYDKKLMAAAKRIAKNNPLEVNEVILGGHDRNGNSKYIPHNTDNVMKDMEKQRKDDQNTFFVSELIGKLSNKYTSMRQVKNNEYRLVSKPERDIEFDKVHELLKETIAYLLSKKVRGKYEYLVVGDIFDAGKHGIGFIKENYEADTDFSGITKALSMIRELPTDMFEAKPRRFVRLAEFSAAVLPKNTSPDVKKALKDAGIKTLLYDENNDTERYHLVKDVSEKLDVRYKLLESEQCEPVAYTLRTDPAPKKTITVYKAFRLINGQLYPMYVGAADALPMGVYLDATEGGYHFTGVNGRKYVPALTGTNIDIPNEKVRMELIQQGYLPEGSTAVQIKVVAFRPGWHGGNLPFFPQGGVRDPLYDKDNRTDDHPYQNYHGADTVICEVEIDADRDYKQEYQDTAERSKKGEIIKNLSGLRFIPKGGYYEYATNPLFANRPDLGNWFIAGSMKINRIMSTEEVNNILDAQKVPRQKWITEVAGITPKKAAPKKKEASKASGTRYRLVDEKIDALIKRYDDALSQVQRANGDPIIMAKELAEQKGLDEATVIDKFGRIFRSAEREAQDHLTEIFKTFGIMNADKLIKTNKPFNQNDLVFHHQQAEEYARKEHLTKDVYDSLGNDGFTYYINTLQVYAHATSLAQIVYELSEKKKNINDIKNTDEQAELLQAYYIALNEGAEAAAKYKNMISEAGRALSHARKNKTDQLKELATTSTALAGMDRTQIEEMNRISEAIKERERKIQALETQSADAESLRNEIQDLIAQKVDLQDQLDALQEKIAGALGTMDIMRKEHSDLLEQMRKLDKEIGKRQARLDVLNKNIVDAETIKATLRQEIEELRRERDALLAEVKKLSERLDDLSRRIDHARDSKDVLEIMKPTYMDNAKTWYYGSMLSGITTHIKNIISTSMNMIFDQIVIDILQPGNIIDSKRKTIQNLKNTLPAAKAKWKDVAESKYDVKIEKYQSTIMNMFNLVFKALAAEDAFLTELSRASKLASIAYSEAKGDRALYEQLYQHPTANMLRQVDIESKRAAYNNYPTGVIGEVWNAIEQFQNRIDRKFAPAGIALRVVVPFRKVPANVFQTSINWSPFGYINAALWKAQSSRTWMSKQQGGDYEDNPNSAGRSVANGGWGRKEKIKVQDPATGQIYTIDKIVADNPFAMREVAMTLTKATLGTLLLAVLLAIGKDLISGSGPRDPDKRAQLEKTGWQEYSVNIGDKWIPYRDSPVSLALSIVGNVQDYMKFGGGSEDTAWERANFALMGIARVQLDKSFLSGLSDAISAINFQNGNYITRTAARTTSTFLMPNMFRQIESWIWGYDQFKPETFTEYMIVQTKPLTRIASIMNTVPRQIDMFGDELKRPGGLWAGMGVPITEQTQYLVGSVDLIEVVKKSTDRGLFIPVPKAATLKIGPDRFKLKGHDFEQYKKLYGKYMSMYVADRHDELMRRLDVQTDDDINDYYSDLGRYAKKAAMRELRQIGLKENY